LELGRIMNQIENVAETFKQGFNCAQAVLSAYCPDLGLDREMAIKLTAPFGGGIAATGEVCGAVSGAIMVLGLWCGSDDVGNPESKEKAYRITRVFIKKFKDKNHSLLCRNLIGMDISTPEGIENARKEGVFMETCPKFVRDASEILEELMKP
jgi:C_GCAxxG_C_C family probable redox protein